MRLFIDVQDKKNKTFPEISREDFEKFLGEFDESCGQNGVAIVRSHVKTFSNCCSVCCENRVIAARESF